MIQCDSIECPRLSFALGESPTALRASKDTCCSRRPPAPLLKLGDIFAIQGDRCHYVHIEAAKLSAWLIRIAYRAGKGIASPNDLGGQPLKVSAESP